MSTAYLTLTPHDPLISRDGRPFGIGQGQRMRGLSWPLPSVVAGSLRTALVKATPGLDFSGDMSQRLFQIEVAGVFPVHNSELYLPAPSDVVAEPEKASKEIKSVHRVIPREVKDCCDFPDDFPLWPVMLPDEIEDFKPGDVPAWWPVSKLGEWLTMTPQNQQPEWFKHGFLNAPVQAMRDHVALDADRGAAAESLIFSSANLHVTHLPRFGAKTDDKKIPFKDRFVEVFLAARMSIPRSETAFKLDQLNLWHPLGGERRMVHWKPHTDAALWQCPKQVRETLKTATNIRMVLATPTIFKHGWRPAWLDEKKLEGTPPGCNVNLKLVGVSNHRWKAVSGWSMAPPPGPKAIRRMVPAGSVYFFKVNPGDAGQLADRWLQPVSDYDTDKQDQRDGFGLALWGTW